jgi:hypothetical protein
MGILQHAAVGQPKLDGPPTILNLGSNSSDGSVSIACSGAAPYDRLSCTVYHLSVDRTSQEEYQRHRAELQKELATNGESEFRADTAIWCNAAVANGLAKDVAKYSPGRAAEVQNRFKLNQAICGCNTKECFASVRLEQQTHEQNECTFSSSNFSADFVKLSDRKWVSNNGPEGICGVVSILTIEHEPNYANLWTYSQQHIYTNGSADDLCKLAHNSTSTYSWNSEKNVRLKCEEFDFTTNPGLEQFIDVLRKVVSGREEQKP